MGVCAIFSVSLLVESQKRRREKWIEGRIMSAVDFVVVVVVVTVVCDVAVVIVSDGETADADVAWVGGSF